MNKILIIIVFTITIILYFLFSHQQIEKYVEYGNTNIDTPTSDFTSAKINYKMGKITLPSNMKCKNLTKEQKQLVDNNCIMQQKVLYLIYITKIQGFQYLVLQILKNLFLV